MTPHARTLLREIELAALDPDHPGAWDKQAVLAKVRRLGLLSTEQAEAALAELHRSGALGEYQEEA